MLLASSSLSLPSHLDRNKCFMKFYGIYKDSDTPFFLSFSCLLVNQFFLFRNWDNQGFSGILNRSRFLVYGDNWWFLQFFLRDFEGLSLVMKRFLMQLIRLIAFWSNFKRFREGFRAF